MCIISVREVPDFEFKDCLFSAVMKNFDQLLPCFSVGWDIRIDIYLAEESENVTSSDSSARYMSILFQSNRNYSKFCACSGCTLCLTHMRRRTAPLVYPKFCAQIGGFSWGTHDWSRGCNARQGDGVKTCRPRHLQWACPLDNHSKICQLSVLSTWLIAWVLLAHANPLAVMRVDKHFTLFNPGIQRCPSDSGLTVHEVKI